MTKPERTGNRLCWLIILLAVIWLCLVAVPAFIDRCSKHEAAWVNRERVVQEIPSEKVSDAD